MRIRWFQDSGFKFQGSEAAGFKIQGSEAAGFILLKPKP